VRIVMDCDRCRQDGAEGCVSSFARRPLSCALLSVLRVCYTAAGLGNAIWLWPSLPPRTWWCYQRASHAAPRAVMPDMMPARLALQRLWLSLRLCVTLMAIAAIPIYGSLGMIEPQFAASPMLYIQILLGPYWLFWVAASKPSIRGRVRIFLDSLNVGDKDELAQAATIAAFIGRLGLRRALIDAERSFCTLPFGVLREEHFEEAATMLADQGLASQTASCKLGEADAFLSHSWRDGAQLKWEKLSAWASRFQDAKGRPPQVWLECDRKRLSQSFPKSLQFNS